MNQQWYKKLWSWIYCFYAELEYSVVIWRFNRKYPGVLSAALKRWRKIHPTTPQGQNAQSSTSPVA
jgi:hypothetical protein